MFDFFTLNCPKPTTILINWQAWIPAIISFISALIIAVISYKTSKKLLGYKNIQEHQMDDKRHMREMISSLINEIDIKNIGNTKIEILWQAVEKIILFANEQNSYSENLGTKANQLIQTIESWQIAETNCKEFIVKSKNNFNASKKEFKKAVNDYFSYYTQN